MIPAERQARNAEMSVPAKVPARPPEKMARPRNRNALRSGLYSFLTTGRYPRGASYISRLTRAMRVAAEAACRQANGGGEPTLTQAALINSMERHEGRHLLLVRWLRENDAALTMDQRLAILRDAATATDARDRCLTRLGIDRDQQADILIRLYGPQAGGQAPAVVDATPGDET
jgi:hypothetical protein